MKETLLHMLKAKENGYVSGQEISNVLNCSRTAVWKHVSELRSAGYEIEAVQKKGYRLLRSPDAVTPEEILSRLKSEKLGKKVVYHTSLKSTQEMAHLEAAKNAEEGVLVVADEQTGGRGRLGRSWHSPAGTGIWMSLVLKPRIALQKAPQLTLLTAVGVVRAIEKETGLAADIKWPNDILLNGKKIVGILTELQAEADQIHSVIIGMGMNINQKKEHFPEDIAAIATSLSAESGKEYSRAGLIAAVMLELEELYKVYLKDGFGLIKLLWESRAQSLGKRITARNLNGTLTGFAKGITDEGVLLLEDDEGMVHSIYSADIEITTTT
ncbi:biotin--[acetyl-CoA-carboxylase] ligase [Fictibacillus aquaticus]|uniref:Bifunctional ligase/repressor BirA n=1 Tax=Fictibacillus aquaticus TaxID=2021314 RepID=A0A235FB28_9BACL|nr:biotin--[acetyl-CoA-carboxylase] ligase [Fictibacillus aquaticus]OYD58550.1 biotin--[acetyl-CoA-carboxylase] ligase [Fictibacillus aquaticus]